MKKLILDNFIKYVQIDTQSDSSSKTIPSTKKQLNLLTSLNDELLELGLTTEFDSENGYVYGTLKGNSDAMYKVGFLAHVDTAPDFSGENVKVQIFENYDGCDIKLNKDVILSPKEFNHLNNYIGQTIITASGDTLLGADDKAGIAIIINMLKYFTSNPDVKHGDIHVAFTRDEEIGLGVNKFDTSKFPVDFAYTIDGGVIGELQYENFNAASASLNIIGKNIHPGEAKDKMINSQELAMKFHNSLPANQKPEFTENYEGFIMLSQMKGNVENTTLNYIIRDHDFEKFNKKKEIMTSLFQTLVKEHSEKSTLTISDSYKNMISVLEDKMHIVEIAKESMIQAGVEPLISPIRGGTDGSNLSFMGVPCPNIFTGGHNFHGRYEYVCLESMEKSCQTIINICKNITK